MANGLTVGQGVGFPGGVALTEEQIAQVAALLDQAGIMAPVDPTVPVLPPTGLPQGLQGTPTLQLGQPGAPQTLGQLAQPIPQALQGQGIAEPPETGIPALALTSTGREGPNQEVTAQPQPQDAGDLAAIQALATLPNLPAPPRPPSPVRLGPAPLLRGLAIQGLQPQQVPQASLAQLLRGR